MRQFPLSILALLAACLPVSTHAAQSSLLRLRLVHDSAAVKYFNQISLNGCAAPTMSFQNAVSHFTASEKPSGNWRATEAAYQLAAVDRCTSQINMSRPGTYTLTYSGTVTISPTTGLSGDASTGFGDLGVNLNAMMVLSQNNAHVGAWILQPNKGNIWGLTASTAGLIFSPSTGKQTRLTSASTITDAGGGVVGYQWADRSSSSTITTGVNTTIQSNAVANTSSAPGAFHVDICRANNSYCATAQIVWADIGGAIPNETTRYANLQTMERAIGANVP